ncbi:Vitamin B12 import ATP-binding protein BtuD [Eubacterium plexicaudatum ASF492]|nr:Vitamin B12 import ATP-binding protein BtuD [Eubacterium plexicaudatum ASF492]
MSYMNSISIIQTSTMSMATNVYMIYNSNLYISLLRDFLGEADETEKADGKINVDSIEEIEFRNVGYTYPENKFSVHNISFTIKPGDRIAIFGKNGSGKSTLFKILCGLYKPSEGRMLINGIDMNDISLKSYRNRISILFQDF